MRNKLIAIGLAVLLAPIVSVVTKRSRLQKALQAPSRFAEINEARAGNKPLLFSVVLPGCPWSAHAAEQVATRRARLGDRSVFLQVGGAVETSGREPFDYLSEHCKRGLCLFDPARGRVEELDELMPVEELAARMEKFAGG